ncbi:MAG TPA: acyl-CoA dehydrogenase family protein, partial [Kofleriaceae bacterium]|nr:acyl-CoA dehydrogenase family protein [Kofleriaceae bacterium]
MMSCRAVRSGDDYVIDGHKWFTSAADGAEFAIVMAVTNPEAAAHSRASMIIVPTSTPGFERARNIKIMGDEGSGYGSHSERLGTSRAVSPLVSLGPAAGVGGNDGVVGSRGVREATNGSVEDERAH